jgi:hypothetical protein
MKEFTKELKHRSHIYLLTIVLALGGQYIAIISTKGVIYILEKYRDLSKVFSTNTIGILPNYYIIEYYINLEPGS